MKSKLLIFTIFLAFWHQVLVANPVTETPPKDEPTKVQANREFALNAYQKGDYAQSVSSLNAILSEEGDSADLYYNLFINYFKQDKLAPALHSLRKSLELKPKFDFSLNAVNELQDKWERRFFLKRTFLSRATLLIHYSTPLAPLLWICLILLGIALRLSIGAIKEYKESASISPQKLSVLSLSSILLIAALSLSISKYLYSNQMRATISEEFYAKVTPSPQSPDILLLKEGEQVIVLERKENWLRLKDLEGKQAWIPQDKLLFSTKGI